MKDRTLLEDLYSYLNAIPAPVGFGRLKKSLLERLTNELKNDPHEFRILCNTTLVLAARDDADCQPTKPWEKLFEKMRIALNKSKQVSQKNQVDPFADVLMLVLTNEVPEEASPKMFPFNKEKKC